MQTALSLIMLILFFSTAVYSMGFDWERNQHAQETIDEPTSIKGMVLAHPSPFSFQEGVTQIGRAHV